MWRHSFYLAFPLTFIHFVYTNMPQVWTLKIKDTPKLLLIRNFATCVLVINAANLTYSVLFDDYCNRGSDIYNLRVRNSMLLRSTIKKINAEHKTTFNAQS